MIEDPFILSGKTAVVTGAGQGLGLEFALALANAGANVTVAEINPETGPGAVEQIQRLGRDAAFLPTDVTKLESVAAMAKAVVDAYGTIHVLHNNAGVGGAKAAHRTDSASRTRIGGDHHICEAHL